MVRDRVVIGCYSKKVREKLTQEGSELTLDKAVDIARTQEMSNSQLQRITPEEKNVNSLREERERKPKHKYARQNQRNNYQNAREGYRQLCSEYGINHEHKKVQQKERHVQNVKCLTILQECANQMSKKEKSKFMGLRSRE